MSYKATCDYLYAVYTTYFAKDTKLQTFNPKKFFSKKENFPLLQVLLTYSIVQDSLYYYNSTQARDAFDGSHTDDLFEIYFIYKYGQRDSAHISMLVHDAWTLSHMYTYNSKNGKLEFFNESKSGASSPIPEIKDEATYQEYVKRNNKDYVKLFYPIDKKSGKMAWTVVQCRRLKQFLPYDKLYTKEQDKNAVPIDTFRSVKKYHKKELHGIYRGMRGLQ